MIDVLKRALLPIRDGIATVGELPQLQAIGRGISRLSQAGTSGYPPDIKRRLMILNLIAYLIVVSTLVYAIQHALLDYETYKPIIWINLALVGAALAVPLAHRINDVAGALLIVVAEWDVAELCFQIEALGLEHGPAFGERVKGITVHDAEFFTVLISFRQSFL